MQTIVDEPHTEPVPEINAADAAGGALPAPPPPPPTSAEKPKGLPDKFWDAEKEQIRVGSLWRSYQALEKRFSAGDGVVPESHEDYCLDCGDRSPDPDVNAVLHRAGFTNDQAQVVYDLARHYVLPELEQARAGAEAAQVQGRLEERFGGKERWDRVAKQLGDWGRAHLPADVMQALGSSYEGVLALHRMMAADEPTVAHDGETGGGPDEPGLRALMQDPKYWRDQDPALVAKVRTGFERLYPG